MKKIILIIITTAFFLTPFNIFAESTVPTSIIPEIQKEKAIESIVSGQPFRNEIETQGLCHVLRHNIKPEFLTIGVLVKYGCIGIQDVPALLFYVANFLMAIIGSVCVLMLIYAGYQFITESFSDSGTKNAIDTVKYAIIGMIIALFSWIIVNFVLANLIL